MIQQSNSRDLTACHSSVLGYHMNRSRRREDKFVRKLTQIIPVDFESSKNHVPNKQIFL